MLIISRCVIITFMKKLRINSIILTTCALLVTVSAVYYFVIRPIQKDKPLRDCLVGVDGGYEVVKENFNKAFLDGKISIAEKDGNLLRIQSTHLELKDECYRKFR